jgi:hypothetical protein
MHEPGLGRVESLSGVSVGHELPNVSKEEEYLEGGSLGGGGGSGDSFSHGMRRAHSFRNLGRWGHRGMHDVRFVLPHTTEQEEEREQEKEGEGSGRFGDHKDGGNGDQEGGGLVRHSSLGGGGLQKVNGMQDGAFPPRSANGHANGGVSGAQKGPGAGEPSKEESRSRSARVVERLNRTAPSAVGGGSLRGARPRGTRALRSASERLWVAEKANGSKLIWSSQPNGVEDAPTQSNGTANGPVMREILDKKSEALGKGSSSFVSAKSNGFSGDEARCTNGALMNGHVAELVNEHVAEQTAEERQAAELEEVGQLVESFHGHRRSSGDGDALGDEEQVGPGPESANCVHDLDGSRKDWKQNVEGQDDVASETPEESKGRRLSCTGQPVGDIPLGEGIQKLAESDRITVEALEKATEELSGSVIVCAEECLRQLLKPKVGDKQRSESTGSERAPRESSLSREGRAGKTEPRRHSKSLEAFGSFVAKDGVAVP